MFLTIWAITILLSFFIGRLAVKIDIKHNSSQTIEEFNQWWTIAFVVVFLLIPFGNILVSIWFAIIVFNESTSLFDGEKMMKKFFLIKDKKNDI